MLRLEVRNAGPRSSASRSGSAPGRKIGPAYTELRSLVQSDGLHTVCQEAGCPNIYECWEDREATFLIGGDAVHPALRLLPDRHRQARPTCDRDEPRRVAESVRTMGLRYATVTGVARDDLPDGGAWLYAETDPPDPRRSTPAPASRCSPPTSTASPSCSARSSTPAPRCSPTTSRPCRGIFKRIRPAFRYERSLDVLTPGPRGRAGHQVEPHPRHGRGAATRSTQALRDLHDAGCDIITITQYLRPSARHHPVDRWVKPEEFVALASRGRADRLRRRDGRSAGALVLPRRAACERGKPLERRQPAAPATG